MFLTRTEHSPIIFSKNIGNEIAAIEIDYTGLDSLLHTLDTSKATGPDGISSHVLKRCHVELGRKGPTREPTYAAPSSFRVATAESKVA